MTSAFFDAFPNIVPEEEVLRDLLLHVTVTRVTMDSNRTLLRIYISSDRLIQKKDIDRIEELIRDQVIGERDMDAKVIETFKLSGQYRAKSLMRVYRPSILHELRGYQMFLYNMFREADISFTDDDTCVLTVADTLVSHRLEKELRRVLEKIFTQRCGLDLKLTIAYEKHEDASAPAAALRSRLDAAGAEGDGAGSRMGAAAEAGTGAAAEGAAEENREGTVSEGDAEAAQGDAEAAPGERFASGRRSGKSGAKKTARRGRGKRGRFGAEDGPRSLIQSENPDVVYGRDFADDAIEIRSIDGEIGTVTIRGQLENLDLREIRTKTGKEMTIAILSVTDFTDTMSVKLFIDKEQMPQFHEGIHKGMFLKIKGSVSIDRFDSDLTIGGVYGIKKTGDFRTMRVDRAPVKRVELHCHTKMSRMDAVCEPSALVGTAMKWGHKAIAVTDHGVVQALPDAWNAASKDPDFKVIYGCEAYLVNDSILPAVNPKEGQDLDGAFVVFDLETTGFSPVTDRIIEIGAVRVENGKVTDRFSEFVNPKVPIPFRIERLTSINDAMVMDAECIETILPRFLSFCSGAVLVGHNVAFDISFIEENCDRLGIAHDFTTLDTVALARTMLPGLSRFKLDQVAKALGVVLGHHHRAVDDAACTADIFLKFRSMLKEGGDETLLQVNEKCRPGPEQIRHLHPYHIILLAANETGRVNLYRCVSESHLNYVHNQRPMLPKSYLASHREGLIIGSACEAGEVFQAVERGAAPKELKALVDFYDYLEIQPLGNNMFLTVPVYDKDGNLRNEPKTVEDLKNWNRRIVELGEQYQKPVAATCDVHFLNPEDAIYREILMTDFEEEGEQPPLYLRTTEEMLEEFEYLGEEKAREVVITNTNLIADRIERFSPVRPDKCPPVIPDSDEILTRICYDRAHELYGDVLPEVVEARLKRELNSIISNGFAVMYIIAQKLVWKSVSDGYLVGSRGSVGSSFVANMAGITEVNSLHPHYLCEKCHFVDFDSELVRKFDGMAGCDMPDRECPKCGAKLKKLGFDIPFETFLGFKGNKEPDIDLNFSGEYQSKAHKYTEVIFGPGQTFRAGTVSGLADKNAYGFVLKYLEQKNLHRRRAEIERLAKGIVGVRRTTGQHPGGIVVLPYGEEINSITPIQHPPNDENTITTHFDFHKIDHNLLKLDILGHDDPTMIRMLEDLTGLSATDVPLDDKKVMSLFQDTSALGIKPSDIGGCPLGSLGIPEFGTDFAIQMLVDTKPQYFSDLVRIAGLAHGTDVWLGNAQDLILGGTCTISTAICTRDDIMIYLIGKGLDPELSFSIMEKVRKGKGLTPEWEEEMRAHDVPEWYIGSCKKIKYMFPKAHAAAYVMMAWRIAWFKINEPLAYYAAYFSVRSPGFDYELMCMGKESMLRWMREFEAKDKKDQEQKDQEHYKAMKVVREMFARGIEFMPIDLNKCRATKFCIVDGKLMPSLNKIEGLGDGAAAKIVDAVKDGPFLSQDNFRARTECSKTVVEKLVRLGILKGLPESDQLSIFDLIGGAAQQE